MVSNRNLTSIDDPVLSGVVIRDSLLINYEFLLSPGARECAPRFVRVIRLTPTFGAGAGRIAWEQGTNPLAHYSCKRKGVYGFNVQRSTPRNAVFTIV